MKKGVILCVVSLIVLILVLSACEKGLPGTTGEGMSEIDKEIARLQKELQAMKTASEAVPKVVVPDIEKAGEIVEGDITGGAVAEPVAEEKKEEVVEPVTDEVKEESVAEEKKEEVLKPVEEVVEEKKEAVDTSKLPRYEVKEGELVNFQITSKDADKDTITHTFSSPLSKEGKWQTQTGDAGEYPITITASDGKAITEKKILLIVAKANLAPEVTEIADITVKEGETIKLEPKVTDKDGDPVTTTISEPIGDDGVWETSYEDAGEYTVTITATDGKETTIKTVKIIVEDINRAPEIIDIVLG